MITPYGAHQSHAWKRALLESGEPPDPRTHTDCIVFGGIAFWSDGMRLACRVIAPGAGGRVGFDIQLRDGAI